MNKKLKYRKRHLPVTFIAERGCVITDTDQLVFV